MQLQLTGNVIPFKSRKSKPATARIAAMTSEPQGRNGCRVFTGSWKQSNGRPQISDINPLTGERTMRDAARVILESDIGRALGAHEHSLHKVGCLPGCCTHGHLRIGSNLENAQDRKADGTGSGRKLNAKRARALVRAAETMQQDGKSRTAILGKLAKRYGITTKAVVSVLRGKSWSKATGIEHVILAPGRPSKSTARILKFAPLATMEVRAISA